MAASVASGGARRWRGVSAGQLVLYVVLLALAVVIVLPIAYMISQSFTPEQDTQVWPIQYIPARPTLVNFARVFSDPTLPAFRWLVNSMFASLSSTGLVQLLSSLASYA